jgi:DNA-binding NarL/FixJ family response regulator
MTTGASNGIIAWSLKPLSPSDAASAYQCYKDTRPDVVIMDISMPGRSRIDAIEYIREFDARARWSRIGRQRKLKRTTRYTPKTLDEVRRAAALGKHRSRLKTEYR